MWTKLWFKEHTSIFTRRKSALWNIFPTVNHFQIRYIRVNPADELSIEYTDVDGHTIVEIGYTGGQATVGCIEYRKRQAIWRKRRCIGYCILWRTFYPIRTQTVSHSQSMCISLTYAIVKRAIFYVFILHVTVASQKVLLLNIINYLRNMKKEMFSSIYRRLQRSCKITFNILPRLLKVFINLIFYKYFSSCKAEIRTPT